MSKRSRAQPEGDPRVCPERCVALRLRWLMHLPFLTLREKEVCLVEWLPVAAGITQSSNAGGIILGWLDGESNDSPEAMANCSTVPYVYRTTGDPRGHILSVT